MSSEHGPRTPTLDPHRGRDRRAGVGADRGAERPDRGPDLSRLDELLGDVLLEEEIGRTSRAVVYRARVGRNRDEVALKVASVPADGEELARFAHEVRLLSEVRHPNVVEVYDWGVLAGGYPFMTLELLATGGGRGSGREPGDPRRPGLGERLRARLAEHGWDPFYDLALQAAAGLDHIHRHGLVHLDVKPDNLGLKEDVGEGSRGGRLHLKILDFGLARSVTDPLDPSSGGEIRGTLAYMAPELLLQEGWDPRTDLYSLGMTLLELATGVLASVGDVVAVEEDRGDATRIESEVAQAVRFHLEGEEVEPLRMRPDMPEPLAHVLRRLLARDPGRRPASAGQLVAELAEAAGRAVDSGQSVLGGEVLLSGRMVGREDAMERLRTALEAAREGRGGLVLIEGEEGMGKSRLLWELRLLAVLAGARVGRARSPSAHGEPLRPVAEALAGLGFELELPDVPEAGQGEPPAWRLAGQVAALLDPVHGAAGSPAAEPDRAPVVLLLDDIHQAAEESRELLALLAAELPRLPALVVATRRPPATESRDPAGRDRLGEVEEVTLLPVLPLGLEDLAAMVRTGLGLEEVPEALVTWLHRRSGGSPRHVHELLRHLIAEGVLVWETGGWRARPRELSRVAPPPGGAPELSWRRLVRLDGEHRRVLDALAVIGDSASLEEVAAVLGRQAGTGPELEPEPEVEPEHVWDALRVLLARGYLDRVTEDRGPVWSFSQQRLRELVYAGMEGGERRRLHRRFADHLQSSEPSGRRGEASPGAVAEHLWRAGEREAALPWLSAAAERAAAVHSYGEAAELYSRAVEAAQAAGEGEAALRARAAEAEALTAAGRYAAALRSHQETLRCPEADLPPGFIARVWLEKGRLHARVGEQREALESYRAGLGRLESRAADVPEPTVAVDLAELEVELLHGEAAALRDLGERDQAFTTARSALRIAGGLAGDRSRGRRAERPLHRQRARLLSTLAGLFYVQGDWRRAERLLRRALWVAETHASDASLAARLRNNLGNVLWKTGSWEWAEEIYRENLQLCERRADLWGRLTALNNLGILLASRGRWQAARDFLSESLAMKRRLGAWETEALTRLNLAEAEEILGCWTAARQHLERGLELLAGQPDHPDRLALLVQLASLERKRGAAEAAEASVRKALEGAQRLGDPDLSARCWRLLGSLEKDRHREDRARAYLQRAHETLEEGGTPEARVQLHLAWAELELAFVGETAEGDERSGEALGRVEEHLVRARQDLEGLGDLLAEGELWKLEAALDARRGRVETADEGFRRAVVRFEELGAPFERACGLYLWGLSLGTLEPARERLGRAAATFLELGAEGEARRVRGALEGLADRRRAGSSSSIPGVLSEVMKVINSTLDLSEVLDRIMDRALERLQAERGLIVLSDPLTGELTPAASRNLRGGEAEERRLSESVVRRVIERGEPVVTVDALEDRRFSAVESIVAQQIRSILCVPLTIRDRRAGAIYVDHGTSRHLFGERERDFLLAFADQAAIAIDNARLYGELDEARRRLEEENESLRREVMGSHHLGRFIGKSPAIVELKRMLERVAVSGATVLLRGESGTGKGLVGRILHAISPRREEPFIHFNCAALPETLAESELFGHEKGAFTGAAGRKPGRFELAQGGTIFLDEIGKISHSIQAKLLRVVEEKIFERVGGTETLEADVRILAATNLDLEAALERGEFREDLYYRLNIIPLTLPPLRERREDIPYLVQHFLERISGDLGRPVPKLDPAVLELFDEHTWPGNVRELESAIHRALVLSPRDELGPDEFSWLGLATEEGAASSPAAIPGDLADGAYQKALDRYDRRLLEAALERCDGKLRETSRVLGISRNTLKAKMKRYGMR